MTKPSPEKTTTVKTRHQPWFWTSALASVILRLVLIIYFPNTLNFLSRHEVSTPVTSLRRREGQPSTVIFYADFITAMLIRAIGQLLQAADIQSLKLIGAGGLSKFSENYVAGDIAALVYLWNPLTIITCLGYSTAPV